MGHSAMRKALAAALAALFVTAARAQSLPTQIDAGHSYAALWMGRNTEVSVAVNTGVAQAGGTAALVPTAKAPPALDVALVPGGAGAGLLTPAGTLRRDQIASIARYTVMSFRSSSARVRRDGRLELSGELTVIHVTREKILGDWSWGYSGSTTYSDPVTKTYTRPVKFVVLTPHAEFLESYLQEPKEVIAAAEIALADFPELPGIVLDSDWPIVAQDEECSPGPSSGGRRDYSGTVCTGKAIAITNPPPGPPPSTGRDYSGMPRPVVPREGPVGIVLHLRLTATDGTSPASAPPH